MCVERKNMCTHARRARPRGRERERETEGSGFGLREIRGTYTALTLLHQSPEPLRQSPTDRGTNALAVWVP